MLARPRGILPGGATDTRTLRVRVELPNPGGGCAGPVGAGGACSAAAGAEVVTVPAEAVIRTGRRAPLVYVVDATGRYRPWRCRTLGGEVDGRARREAACRPAGQAVVTSGSS